jgi:hypothetical protein
MAMFDYLLNVKLIGPFILFCIYLADVKKAHNTYIRLFWSMAFLCVLSMVGCSFEKRLYRPGWHVEWPPRSEFYETSATIPAPRPAPDQCMVRCDSMHVEQATTTRLATDETVFESKPTVLAKSKMASAMIPDHDEKSEVTLPLQQGKGHRQMHEKATLSFAMGVVSISSLLAPLLISGLGIAVILALGVVLVVAAVLAMKWSKMALEDMYMARNRYAGKALATAAMILAVLALLALVGVIVIALLGAAFLSVV